MSQKLQPLDDDLDIEEIDSEIKDGDVTPLDYNLLIYPADYTLEVLYQKWKNKDLIIPSFQRGFVWTRQQSSRLIESIIMGLPIPPIFLHSQNDGTYLVIDGRQRLESIVSFFNGHFKEKENSIGPVFKLERINPKNSLYKKTFEDFDEANKRKFKDYVLRAITIKQLDPKDESTSIYHIFERLNTGGTALHDQEIRNCVYEGKLNTLLLELNDYGGWRKILGKEKKDSRQRDVGYILRYISLFHNKNNYKKPMKDFLSKYMSKNKDPSDDFLREEETRFKKTCDVILEKLGEKPFHHTYKMNPSLFDSVFVAFANNYQRCPKDIKTRFSSLCDQSNFKKMISSGTTDPDVVSQRLKLAASTLFG